MSVFSLVSLLMACRTDPPVGTEPPSPTPEPSECDAYVWRDEVWDCRTIDPCVPDLEHRLACCECDPYFCVQTLECVPPEFPPDVGPMLSFDRAVQGEFAATGGAPSVVLITPDLVVVSDSPTRAVQAVCARANNTFTCEPLMVGLEWGALRFEVFDLLLTDGDGDGVADGAMLRFSGRYTAPMQESPFATVIPLSADAAGMEAALPEGVLPTRAVQLRLGELGLDGPIPTLLVGDEVRTLEAVPGVGGLIAYRTVDGQAVLPWGAELSVEGALSDLSGNPVDVVSASVVADPGPWTDNPGFEGSGGWVQQATVYPFVSLPSPGWEVSRPDPDAWDGGHVAYAYAGGLLLGQAAIPAEASTLSFALRAEGYYVPEGSLTVVTAANERTEIWSFDPTQMQDCGTSSPCLPWTLQTADIAPWAGQSVFFELELRALLGPTAYVMPGPPELHVAVDGFALE